MRIFIDNGKLVEFRSISDPHVYLDPPYYDTVLKYQVYHLDGSPSTGSYRGEGAIDGRTLILGDPYTKATLSEYHVDRDPTADSKDRFEGFLQGLDDKRKQFKVTKKTQNKSENWWDGYRDAWQQKDEQRRMKNPSSLWDRDWRAAFRKDLAALERKAAKVDDHAKLSKVDDAAYRLYKKAHAHAPYPYDAAELERLYAQTQGAVQRAREALASAEEIAREARDQALVQARREEREAKQGLSGFEKELAIMRARQRNPQEIADDFVSRHADDTTWQQRIPGGTTRPPCEFERTALASGLAVELEHTTDPAIALEIAMDHLDEDPRYYARHNAKPSRRRNPASSPTDSRIARIGRRVGDA